MYPVEGRVVYRDGTPFTQGLVVFEPLEADVRVSAIGEIHKDGTFRLGTYSETDGVPEGRYRVLVVPPMPAGESSKPLPIDVKYIRLETSPLEYTVVRGKNEVTFEVDRPGAASGKGPRNLHAAEGR
ncbi:MAG TPA: hypothetical protein VNK04_07430 [Gemmataceae bacterium]|nr:hypothetical protein [Gemmataceae bacterium]